MALPVRVADRTKRYGGGSPWSFGVGRANLQSLSIPSSWLAAGVAAGIGVWALVIYWHAGFLLLQEDTVSHLDTARGVFDSLAPAFAQLGGVWLPLPHVLMLPLVWITPLWRSGLAGSIPSLVAFVVATVYLQRIVLLLSGSVTAGLLAALIFVSNPNMLYLQATPMTESLTICLILAATYHLLRYARTGSLAQLLVNALLLTAATLTRYETWILVPASGCVVLLSAYARSHDRPFVEGSLVLWGCLAAYGIALWLLYNQVIFGDLLNFEHGPGSAARSAAAALLNRGLPTRGDALIAVQTYGWATIDNLGLPLCCVALAGVAALLLARLSPAEKLAALTPLSLFAFSALSLFRGDSVVYVPQLAPFSYYNDRYGLLMLPAALICAGLLARRFRAPGMLVLGAVALLQVVALPAFGHPNRATAQKLAGKDATRAAHAWSAHNVPLLDVRQAITLFEPEIENGLDEANTQQAAQWLRAQQSSGPILIAAAANGRFLFTSGLPLQRFVTEGIARDYTQALRDPAQSVEWIVFRPDSPQDPVARLMQQTPPAGFQLVYDNGTYRLYHRQSP